MTKPISDAVAAAAAKVSQRPSEDRLIYLRARVAEVRDLELKIEQVEEELANLRRRQLTIQSDELPALFDECGLSELKLNAQGNMPEYLARMTTQINASLPKDDRGEQALKKFKWLAELSKNTFTILFDKADLKKAKKLEQTLKKAKVPFTKETRVHASTLTAEIRRRYADGRPLPPADLELLGAYVRPLVKIEKVKEKK